MADPFGVQGKSILLCDDEGMILLSLRRAVEKLGMRIVGVAHRGEDAVSIALQERPEYVLMDFHLDGLDGIEAARQILAAFPTCILLMSGHTEEETRLRASEAGVHGFLSKPFTLEDLPKHLEEAFQKYCEQHP
jgi:DNA-binding NarL/FixJ family response regulator